MPGWVMAWCMEADCMCSESSVTEAAFVCNSNIT